MMVIILESSEYQGLASSLCGRPFWGSGLYVMVLL